MDFALTDDQERMRDGIARLVEREIRPVLAANPRDRALPKAEMVKLFERIAEYGLLCPRLPEEAGGPGISMLDYGIMFEQIPPTVSMSMLSQDSCITRLNAECTEEQKARFLPDLVAGHKLACTGSTEPDTGSDPRGIKTRLTRKGDKAVLNGRKMWITNVSACDLILVTCIDEGRSKDGRPVIIKVVVERDKSPFEAREIDAIGLNQGYLGEAVFDNCEVPAENIVEADSGTRVLNRSWYVNRCMVGLQAVHLAERAYLAALDYGRVRKQFGKPIAAHQLVQKNFSDMVTAITASRMLCYRALWMMDAGEEAGGASAMAKRFAQMNCTEAVWQAMNVLGAMGLSREAGLEEMYRDIRMLPIPDGTNEILALIHGREITGFEAFRGAAGG
ncbi:acyl-CoA dehydrogenase family protein [Xanthobacter pseudotagetidis]|uniref:acyl-CoA dehydrogenase family protein n=1 Tax=Xanthobacter pseudotagetidis TaxID=3119911 RepID=UPI00372A5A66